MQSEPYTCNICNIIFVNSEQLLQHEMIVHVDQMLQCQSCNRVFTNKEEFKKHEIEIHSGSKSSSNLSEKQTIISELGEDIESALLKGANEEKHARKRTRGPYRKSAST
jgi:predicted nucleic acid binding AN1-type Zn finger protein